MAILPKGFPIFSRPKAAFGDWGFPSKRVLTSKRYACSIIAAAIYVSFSLLKRSFFERKCNLIDAGGHCARVCRCGIVTVFLSRGGFSLPPMQASRVIELTPLRRKTRPKGVKVSTLSSPVPLPCFCHTDGTGLYLHRFHRNSFWKSLKINHTHHAFKVTRYL